jgi:hypothetical protein
LIIAFGGLSSVWKMEEKEEKKKASRIFINLQATDVFCLRAWFE